MNHEPDNLMAEIDTNAAEEGRELPVKEEPIHLQEPAPDPPEAMADGEAPVVVNDPAPPAPPEPPTWEGPGKPGRLRSRVDYPITIKVVENGKIVEMRVSPRSNQEIDGEMIHGLLPNGLAFVPYR